MAHDGRIHHSTVWKKTSQNLITIAVNELFDPPDTWFLIGNQCQLWPAHKIEGYY